MPNAKDATIDTTVKRVFNIGEPGAGKTTQFLTFPGKKFAYLFDPNSLASLAGQDVEYETFLPADIQLGLTSLKAENAKLVAAKEKRDPKKGAELYYAWEADYEKRVADGYFEKNGIKNLMLDSATTFQDMVMDGILAVNGRAGNWPQQDDYGPQMVAISKVFRSITSLGLNLYCTGHLETKQDGVTKKLLNQPLLTGRLKVKIPILFTDYLVSSATDDGKGGTIYQVQTRPDKLNPACRCSRKDVSTFEDVTIDWKKNVEGQGLGGLLFK